jgi:uncharacterized membrane protein HdeD (DUF308 family)
MILPYFPISLHSSYYAPGRKLMNIKPKIINVVEIADFGKYSLIIGLLLILLGTVGIILPQFMSLEASVLIASLLLIGGIFWLVHSFKARSKKWTEWLKPVLLLITGGLILLYPMTGVATIGMIMAVYLLIDAYGSFIMSYNIKHKKSRFWMLFNGAISFLLAFLFLIGWPESSLFLVGLYISISLLLDGWALISIYWVQQKLAQKISS